MHSLSVMQLWIMYQDQSPIIDSSGGLGSTESFDMFADFVEQRYPTVASILETMLTHITHLENTGWRINSVR